MLTYRIAGIYLAILAAGSALLMMLDLQYAWLTVVFVIVYLSLLAAGSVKICSGFYMDVFCKGKSTDKIVALTFDDGPDPDHTPGILATLEKQAVKATFFVIGEKAEKEPELLREIHAAGHSIGNHSYSHAFLFDLYGSKKMEQDLQKADEVIMKITGEKPVLFRPPYGVTNPILAKVVRKRGFNAIGWSVRSLDTIIKDEKKLMERITDRLHPGAVILLHDNRALTGMVLEGIILKIKHEGFRIVGMNELMH